MQRCLVAVLGLMKTTKSIPNTWLRYDSLYSWYTIIQYIHHSTCTILHRTMRKVWDRLRTCLRVWILRDRWFLLVCCWACRFVSRKLGSDIGHRWLDHWKLQVGSKRIRMPKTRLRLFALTLKSLNDFDLMMRLPAAAPLWPLNAPHLERNIAATAWHAHSHPHCLVLENPLQR